jgi:hypothetical protein
MRWLCYDLPVWLLSLPRVRDFLKSWPVLLLRDYLFKPLVFTAAVWIFFPLYGASMRTSLVSCGVILVLASVFGNTRLGLTFQEAVVEAVVRTWRRFHLELFPALFHFVMDLFKQLIEAVERILYTVDEWLRFRKGESRLSLVGKTILGAGWFLVAYLVRIYVNLFIEPTINPIKHFPVVTVGAKLILPFTLVMMESLSHIFMPLGPLAAYVLAGGHVILIPGIFGFLVWEMKENWRLYEANRPQTLQPVAIGHHGETLPRLLRPGFHSGTIPKLYAKIRRAERKAHATGDWTNSRRRREALHEVQVQIRHFVERDFLLFLHDSKSWGGRPINVGEIGLGCNRIGVEFVGSTKEEESLVIAFEEWSGWLVGRVARSGWLHELSPAQTAALAAALTGFYKKGTVERIGEQKGMVPFRDVPVNWQRWVEVWDADQAGKGLPETLLSGVAVLP